MKHLYNGVRGLKNQGEPYTDKEMVTFFENSVLNKSHLLETFVKLSLYMKTFFFLSLVGLGYFSMPETPIDYERQDQTTIPLDSIPQELDHIFQHTKDY